MVFLRPPGVLFRFLGSLLEALEAIWSRLGVKSGWFWGTLAAPQFFIFFLSDFGSQKGTQREAFWEPKRSKNRSKIEVQS